MSLETAIALRDEVSRPASVAAEAVDRLKTSLDAADASIKRFGSGLDSATGKLENASKSLDKVRRASRPTSDATDDLSLKFTGLTKDIGEMTFALDPVTLALEGAAAVMATVTAAAVGLGAAMYEGAKESLDAAQSYQLSVDRVGLSTLAMIRDVEREIPQSEATIVRWTRSLEAVGITDVSRLRRGVESIAIAEEKAEGGGERLRSVLERLSEQGPGSKLRFSFAQLAGVGVSQEELLHQLGINDPKQFEQMKKSGQISGQALADAIIDVLHNKGSPALATEMRGLSTIAVKFKDDVDKIFEEVDTSAFVTGLESVEQMFSQASTTGEAFRAVAKDLFGDTFGLGAASIPLVRRLLAGFAYEIVTLDIELKPVIKQFEDFWETTGAGDTAAALFTSYLKDEERYLRGWVDALSDGIAIAKVFFGYVHEAEIAGQQVIAGFANGLTDLSAVKTAVDNMGSSVIGWIKDALHIHSPSRLTIGIGAQLPAGLAIGARQGAPDARAAVREMVGPRDLVAPLSVIQRQSIATSASLRAAPEGARTFAPQITVHVGAGVEQETVKALRSELADLFNEFAIMMGVQGETT